MKSSGLSLDIRRVKNGYVIRVNPSMGCETPTYIAADEKAVLKLTSDFVAKLGVSGDDPE